MASAGDAELILNVDATVARPTSSTAEPTMSDMAAQLQEAKAAALAAADRMAALLKQMEVMEATAAKRRLAELAIQERIATAGATASAAAASASVAAASTGSAEAAPAAAAPPSQTVRFPSSESGAERDSSGDSKRGRQITMTDVYGEDDDKAGQARINKSLSWLNDTSKKPQQGPTPRDSRADSDASVAEAPKLGTLMGVFVPCLQNILGTLYFLRLSWIVALQGISKSLLLVGIACTTTLMTSLSLSAIATNGAIKAGGPYYLISRALGPEFGGSVGLCFYLGTTVAGAMYVLGTAEPLLLSFPGLQICGLDPLGELPTWNIVVYGYLILAFCATVITLGVKYVSKISPAFLVCVLISIFLIWVGMLAGDREIRAEVLDASCSEDGESSNASAVGLLALGGVNATIDSGRVLMPLIGAPSRANIDANWKFDELIEDDECTDAGYDCDFVFGLALFFPSVTGIMAGSNRSGDLKDAQHSIPLGTLAATLCTSVLYLLTTFMFGAVANRDVLADKNSVLLAAVVSWPSEYVVRVGVVLSALGAALQSLTGAPRLLQAIANDNLIPILRPFRGTGEPRKPLALTIVICAAFISTGNVNSVAPIITMFFLLCYAFVNAACLLQDVLQEPNWRPRFRFYHPATSATGLGLCLFIMFYTRWYFALASIMMVIALYGYIQYRKVEAQWGDGLQGLRYHQARKSLEELEKLDGASHIKNWRPQVLILCKPDARKQGAAHPKLIALLKQLKGARGLSIVGSIVPGRLAESAKVQATMDRALRRLRDENKVQGFTQVIMTPNVTLGLSSLIQTSGLGGLYPNTVMLGWSRHWKERTERAQQMTTLLLTASAYNQAIVVVKGMEHIPDGGARMTRPMDIWWMVHDGGLQLLLATILRRGRVWATCTLRVFCVLQYGEDPDELQKKVVEFLYQMRIDAEVKCVVLSEGAALVDRPGLAASKLGSALGGGTSDGKPGKKPKEVAWQLNSAIVGAGPIGDLDLSEPGFDEESVNMRRAERRGSAGEISPSMARSASGLLQRSNSAGASILSPKRGKQNNGNIFAAAAAQAVAACEAAAASSSSSTDDARGDRSRAELASTDPGPKRHEPRWPEERAPVSRKASFVNARELVDTSQVEMMETQLEVDVEDDNGGAPAAAPFAAAPAGAPGPAEEVRRPRRYTKEEGEDTEEDASTLLATRILNRLIFKYSKDAALVMTNLPMPSEAQTATSYMHQVDTLMESLPLCMLIMGQKNSDVVTMYS